MLIVIGIVVGGEGDDSPAAEPQPVSSWTAGSLLAEREKNATAFDKNIKGKMVRVSGYISSIDNSAVTLVDQVNPYGNFTGVVVRGIPDTELLRLQKGQQYSTTCKVGDYIIGSIYCRAN